MSHNDRRWIASHYAEKNIVCCTFFTAHRPYTTIVVGTRHVGDMTFLLFLQWDCARMPNAVPPHYVNSPFGVSPWIVLWGLVYTFVAPWKAKCIWLLFLRGGEKVLHRLVTICFDPLNARLPGWIRVCTILPFTWIGCDRQAVVPDKQYGGYNSCCGMCTPSATAFLAKGEWI